jgi:ABC-type transport system substrate-binding protein
MKPIKILPFLFITALFIGTGCQGDGQQKSDKGSYELGRPLQEAQLQVDAEPDRLNPLLTNSNYSNTVLANIFSYLLDLDPLTLEVQPRLAVSRPEIQQLEEGPYAGGVSYTFEIQPEAAWDNGSPVTAEDFIFTLKAVFNPKVPATIFRVYLSFIKAVEVDPDNPKRFTVFSDKQYIIGEEVIGNAIPLMPAYHYDPDGLLADIPLSDLLDQEKAKALAASNPNLQAFADAFSQTRFSREPEGVTGSGPYRLASWETGQKIRLERKKDWWGDKVAQDNDMLKAYPEALVFRPISDPNTAVAAVKDGQIDVMANVPPKQFQELQATEFVKEQFNFHSPSSLVHTFIYVNTRLKKLSDKKVRQALAYALNVDEIINTVFSGLAVPSTGPVHPSFSYYNDEIEPIPYNPERARALLEEAGWTDSNDNGIVDKEIDGERRELSLEYNYTAGRDISQNVALLLKESAKQAGIEITLNPQEHSVNIENLKRRDFELVGGAKSIQPVPWEPKQDFHSEGDDRTGFASPETDAMIDRIQSTFDKAKRKEMYLELQEILHEEMPIIPMIIPKGRLIIHERFETPITPIFPGYAPRLLKVKEALQ